MWPPNGTLVENTVLRVKVNESNQQGETLKYVVSRHMVMLVSRCCSPSAQQRRASRPSMQLVRCGPVLLTYRATRMRTTAPALLALTHT